MISGADGFIGSHLVRYFSEHDFEVYALTLPDSPTRFRIEGLKNVRILDKHLSELLSECDEFLYKPTAFIHLAWSGVAPEARNSVEKQATNIELCMQAVRLAAKIGAERFILPGSTMEYSYCGQEINEKACPSPQNAYGAAKISARYLCEALCEELNIAYIYAVITGIYSEDRRDNNVIYYTINELLNGRKPSLTALEQKWDYVYIDDVVCAFYLIALKGKNGAFYSIGHGDNWALANYILKIRDEIDSELPLGIGEVPYKDARLPSSCVDMKSLKCDTGFEPKISFEEGIRKVIQKVKEDM